MNAITTSFQYGDHTVTLETGRIARQATSSVLITMGDTTLLVTVVGKKEVKEDQDFFPLTINYVEKTYAAGKIPGGYFKREGRPTEHATLIARLIDRPLRPLFPKGFCNEVQVVITVMSLDENIQPDIPAMIGASAALSISGIPFNGPIGAARVGYQAGQYLLNPNDTTLETSALDLVVAGTKNAVLMVESEAKMLSEDIMLGAVVYGHEQMQVAIDAIETFANKVGTSAWDWQPPVENTALKQAVSDTAHAGLTSAYQIADKRSRAETVAALRTQTLEKLVSTEENDTAFTDKQVEDMFAKLEKEIVRTRILDNQPRIDGRDTKTVRPIEVATGILPRTHGSALFTRGETQAIVAATLGTDRDAQIIDALAGEYRETFMLHYNFPPYCVGETGMMGSPKRREIGHGRLAKRGISASLPSTEEFPYVIRVVSEITESNGSSSMASVCGTSLALMDAGVPVKEAIAGIAMGLVKEGEQYAILTDIMGDEDHLGDMDFKVAGSANGITALQMDIKIDGITKEIMEQALAQAHEARLHILDIMSKEINTSRQDVSQYAPRITTIKIDPDKIRDVIGKGGATIRTITEETGCTIDIEQDGTVRIAAVDGQAAQKAQAQIERLTADIEVGKIYEGPVARILDFGAIVNILPGKDGLVHISQIAQERINKVSDKLEEGQIVKVKVLEIDRQGRVRLSMKEVEQAEQI